MDSTIKLCEPVLRVPTNKRVNFPAINSKQRKIFHSRDFHWFTIAFRWLSKNINCTKIWWWRNTIWIIFFFSFLKTPILSSQIIPQTLLLQEHHSPVLHFPIVKQSLPPHRQYPHHLVYHKPLEINHWSLQKIRLIDFTCSETKE